MRVWAGGLRLRAERGLRTVLGSSVFRGLGGEGQFWV